jgi:hypothetical protein
MANLPASAAGLVQPVRAAAHPAQRLRQGQAVAAYVSGDERATAERLLQIRVVPALVAGDSCASTTPALPCC